MIQLRSFFKFVACAMFASVLAPATSGAQPQPLPDGPDFNSQSKSAARLPRVIIVAPDNVTPVHTIQCESGTNVGLCLDLVLNSNGLGFVGQDDNRIATLIAGRAHVDSEDGALAVAYVDYSYDDLYLEWDIKLRAAE